MQGAGPSMRRGIGPSVRQSFTCRRLPHSPALITCRAGLDAASKKTSRAPGGLFHPCRLALSAPGSLPRLPPPSGETPLRPARRIRCRAPLGPYRRDAFPAEVPAKSGGHSGRGHALRTFSLRPQRMRLCLRISRKIFVFPSFGRGVRPFSPAQEPRMSGVFRLPTRRRPFSFLPGRPSPKRHGTQKKPEDFPPARSVEDMRLTPP